jgi:hypothetical protein
MIRKLLIAPLLATPILFAAPAHADEAGYIADLNRDGVPYNNPGQCSRLRLPDLQDDR